MAAPSRALTEFSSLSRLKVMNLVFSVVIERPASLVPCSKSCRMISACCVESVIQYRHQNLGLINRYTWYSVALSRDDGKTIIY